MDENNLGSCILMKFLPSASAGALWAVFTEKGKSPRMPITESGFEEVLQLLSELPHELPRV